MTIISLMFSLAGLMLVVLILVFAGTLPNPQGQRRINNSDLLGTICAFALFAFLFFVVAGIGAWLQQTGLGL